MDHTVESTGFYEIQNAYHSEVHNIAYCIVSTESDLILIVPTQSIGFSKVYGVDW